METQLEEYNKILHIEAMTMSDMVREEITPACIAFENELAGTVNAKKAAGVSGGMEAGLLGKVSELTEELYTKSAALDEAVAAVPTDDNEKAAHYYHDVVISAMDEVRAPADKLEGLVGKKFWPFPTYSDILFYVIRTERNLHSLIFTQWRVFSPFLLEERGGTRHFYFQGGY